MSLEYYDKSGAVITGDAYRKYKARGSMYRVVATTRIQQSSNPDNWCVVSTVWTGTDMATQICFDTAHQPLIFETAVFRRDWELKPDSMKHYPTIERARAGHDAVVNLEAAQMDAPEITQLWRDE